MFFSQYLNLSLTCEQQQQAIFFIIHNFQICENEINIYLQVIILNNFRDRLITTFVSFDLVKRLNNQLIVVMKKNVQTYSLKRFKNKRFFDIKSALWKDDDYRSIDQIQFSFLNKYASNRENFVLKSLLLKSLLSKSEDIEHCSNESTKVLQLYQSLSIFSCCYQTNNIKSAIQSKTKSFNKLTLL